MTMLGTKVPIGTGVPGIPQAKLKYKTMAKARGPDR